MKDSVLNLLYCPICHAKLALTEDGKSCKCKGEGKNHCFDFSKSGYLNLAGPHGGSGDQKDAIQARREFLNAGYYQPLADLIVKKLNILGAKSVLDAGCGEGYYTNRFSEHRDVLGVDLSKDGIDAAAKSAKAQATGAGFVIASLFSMPIADQNIDAVLNIFAPCAEDEFLRVLKPGGYVILVAAGEKHLLGLKEILYKTTYLNRGRADLPRKMTLVAKDRLQYSVTVKSARQIAALFSMTPYYWRTSAEDQHKLDGLEELTTDLDFDIYLFRKDT
ncbi:MAG: methyltransferase domain-containing protein [Clostridia bacterium]|nr:methyltransferase domain-containing protein [Clostridia bacterium]